MNKVVAAITIGILAIVAFVYFTMDFPFSLRREDFKEEYTIQQKWDLPDRLEEISGMDFIDDNRMAAIQDEEGIIFIYNLNSKKIEQEVKFGKSGDYEGLAIVNNDAFVLRSDGILFEIKNYLEKNPKVTKHETFIKAKHNAEGLCADLKNNRLLLAVKDRDPLSNNTKGIYAFDLKSKKLLKTPAFASASFGDTSVQKVPKGSSPAPGGTPSTPRLSARNQTTINLAKQKTFTTSLQLMRNHTLEHAFVGHTGSSQYTWRSRGAR